MNFVTAWCVELQEGLWRTTHREKAAMNGARSGGRRENRRAIDEARIRALVDEKIELVNDGEINAEIAKGTKGREAAMEKLQKEMESIQKEEK